ncbi:(Fe-S)-binding protein [Rudanella paleaurantiibacter]|uniref:(Fe-S)-binding protein n=1 Tax=Rudanella paleaurantiibacter TaxID=2614655 RepID=A0A7J5TTQ7_9BACT|nr:(Fe-S)-binding protein [Rudanella paleaurantiibacter]KAB7727278.1 (Fe-S)-binding protein [Rudanella paleaurantiibacter]
MRVALFVPCYVDQFYPQVAIAMLRLLQQLGCTVDVPAGQTCCGQPMANAGFNSLSGPCFGQFNRVFVGHKIVVVPSGSCVLHLKEHNPAFEGQIYELCEFLTDVLAIKSLPDSSSSQRGTVRVGLHQSCHGQRGLRLAAMSERNEPAFSKPETLLRLVEGVELVPLNRADECCGFGGTFCVTEEAVSVKMGKDRVADHLRAGADVITGTDMSCLMHLEGILRRQGSTVQVKHIAEILYEC